MIDLYLPFPPSLNNYYVKTRRGVFISQKGKKFRKDVAESVFEQTGGLEKLGDTKLRLEVIFFMPDKRGRDLDNYLKALLDAITHTELWDDDQYIDQVLVFRGETHFGGSVRLRIAEAGPVIPLGWTGELS